MKTRDLIDALAADLAPRKPLSRHSRPGAGARIRRHGGAVLRRLRATARSRGGARQPAVPGEADSGAAACGRRSGRRDPAGEAGGDPRRLGAGAARGPGPRRCCFSSIELSVLPAGAWSAAWLGENALVMPGRRSASRGPDPRGADLRPASRRARCGHGSRARSPASPRPVSRRASTRSTAPTTARSSSPPGTRSRPRSRQASARSPASGGCAGEARPNETWPAQTPRRLPNGARMPQTTPSGVMSKFTVASSS